MANVLIVDDDPRACLTLEALLSPYGHSLQSVHSAKDALVQLVMGETDLIITDVMMPVMDGFELCRQVKAN